MSYLRLFPSAELFVPCFAYAEQTHYTQSGVLRTQPHIISQGACFEAHFVLIVVLIKECTECTPF